MNYGNENMKILEVDKKQIDDVLEFCDYIVDNCHPRLSGTPGCKKAADLIEDKMEKICGKDNTSMEEFKLHPKAFLKWIRPTILIYIISSIFLLIRWIEIATIGYLLADALLIGQFVFYSGIFDFLWPEATGYNVFGKIEPEGEVKQQIIISGHHDAAYVFNLMDKSPILYGISMFGGISMLFFTTIVSIVGTLMKWVQQSYPVFLGTWLHYFLIIAVLFIIPLWFFTTDRVTPGVGDNLIAVGIVLEMGKALVQLKAAGDYPLQNTRIILMSFDGEEAGTRGARAYARAHKDELLDLKTYNFNMDGLYSVEGITFLESDLNGTIKLDKEMAQECTNIAHKLGYPEVNMMKFPFGGGATDAAQFGKIGVTATSFFGVETTLKALDNMVYHSPRDTTDAIDPKVIQASLEIMSVFIQKREEEIT
ncbi:MAG: M28 family peptidase [Candidatus Lokiarchaeota archaeon]|nr:M28 family peptidase [Candidatus Lokiarchaeota archaeon]